MYYGIVEQKNLFLATTTNDRLQTYPEIYLTLKHIDSLVPMSIQLSPESKSLKVTKPTAEWREKHRLVEYQMKERRNKIKTLESRPSIDFNYLSLNWISNIIHEVLDAGRYDIEAHLAW